MRELCRRGDLSVPDLRLLRSEQPPARCIKVLIVCILFKLLITTSSSQLQ